MKDTPTRPTKIARALPSNPKYDPADIGVLVQDAPTIGIALEDLDADNDGLIWVLITSQ